MAERGRPVGGSASGLRHCRCGLRRHARARRGRCPPNALPVGVVRLSRASVLLLRCLVGSTRSPFRAPRARLPRSRHVAHGRRSGEPRMARVFGAGRACWVQAEHRARGGKTRRCASLLCPAGVLAECATALGWRWLLVPSVAQGSWGQHLGAQTRVRVRAEVADARVVARAPRRVALQSDEGGLRQSRSETCGLAASTLRCSSVLYCGVLVNLPVAGVVLTYLDYGRWPNQQKKSNAGAVASRATTSTTTATHARTHLVLCCSILRPDETSIACVQPRSRADAL